MRINSSRLYSSDCPKCAIRFLFDYKSTNKNAIFTHLLTNDYQFYAKLVKSVTILLIIDYFCKTKTLTRIASV